MTKAANSGIRLTEADAALVKGMLARGDRQHDIAALFGVNGGRIAEVATGDAFKHVRKAVHGLPRPGPYPTLRQALAVIDVLMQIKRLSDAAAVILGSSVGTDVKPDR
jgi:hypothetical protein